MRKPSLGRLKARPAPSRIFGNLRDDKKSLKAWVKKGGAPPTQCHRGECHQEALRGSVVGQRKGFRGVGRGVIEFFLVQGASGTPRP